MAKKLVILALLVSLTGCTFAHRHPTAMKVIVVGGAVGLGGGIALANRTSYCSYTYDGKPYYGTSCPPPRTK